MNGDKEERKKLSTKDLILLFMETLSSRCWARLGLIRDEYGELRQDLDEARLAIDTMDAILNAIKDRLDEREVKELSNLLSTLKLNYVNQYEKKKKEEKG